MSPGAVAAEAFPDSVARLRAALALEPRVAVEIDGLDWAMRLPSGGAPGFVYLAGARRGVAIGGGGADLAAAAARLAGEAGEARAQETAPAPSDRAVAPALAAIWGEGPSVAAVSLPDGAPVGAPLSAIFPAFAGRADAPPRSLGLAAGRDRSAARLAGLLELVERDAAAAWWCGDTRAYALCALDAAPAAAGLAAMRAGAPDRKRATTLLALPAAADVPVVCALSCDPDGHGGLAFGLKAALEVATAAVGATCELLQMEIALEIARMRAQQGRPAANDAGVLGRAALDPDGFAAFAATPARRSGGSAPAGLDELVARLATWGIAAIVADLAGTPGGLAVCKAFAPGLRPLPGPGVAPPPGTPGAVAELM